MSNNYINRVYSDRYKVTEEFPSPNNYEYYFKGRDSKTGKEVQLRIIPIDKDNPALFEQTQKFIDKEFAMLRKLHHPGLPVFVADASDANDVVIITEYRKGQPLEEILTPNVQFSEDETLKFLGKILPIIKYLHSQDPPVIYRDLQPKNIYIDVNGDYFLTKYEAARTYKADKVKDTVVVSSRGYNPPEQALGKGQSDPRSDIYSIGMIIFQMLTGKDPTASLILPKISDIRKDVSSIWTTLVSKATNIKQDKRYASVDELMTELHRIKTGSLDYNPAQGSIAGMTQSSESQTSAQSGAPPRPGTQSEPPRPGTQPAPPRPGTQPAPPRPGTQPAPPRPGTQPAPPRPGIQPAPPRPGIQPAPLRPGTQQNQQPPAIQPKPAVTLTSDNMPKEQPQSQEKPTKKKGLSNAFIIGIILLLIGCCLYFPVIPEVSQKLNSLISISVGIAGLILALISLIPKK